MDEKTFLEVAKLQIANLRATLQTQFPDNTNAADILQNCELGLTALVDGMAEGQVIPAGFTEETFRAFLESNATVLTDDETTLDDVAPNITDVAGLVDVNGDGNLVEVGNFDASADAIAEQLDELELAGEEIPEASNLLTVTYTRVNEGELTEANVRSILDHPISQTLNKLGNIQLLSIEPTDVPSKKEAVFVVLEEGRLPLKALALQAVAYRGVHVFPGMGAVQAIANVNFIE